VWHGQVGDLSGGISIEMPGSHPLGFRVTADAKVPTITIKSPLEGATVNQGKALKTMYSCTDTGGSGLASCVGDVANGSSVDTSKVGTHSFTVISRDRAGNLSVATTHYRVLDVTPPLVTLNLPSSGATYSKGQVVYAMYSCTDTGSGIATCAGTVPSGSPIDTSKLGNNGFSVTAVDNAGNTTKVSVTYKVVFPWNGFFGANGSLAEPPAANAGGAAGDLLTVRFDLGGNQGTQVTASIKVLRVDCTTGAPIGKATGLGGSVSYSNGQYVFNWFTKTAWAGTCQQLQVTLVDGTVHTVNFQFTAARIL
jgi:hypothetical protein